MSAKLPKIFSSISVPSRLRVKFLILSKTIMCLDSSDASSSKIVFLIFLGERGYPPRSIDSDSLTSMVPIMAANRITHGLSRPHDLSPRVKDFMLTKFIDSKISWIQRS
jgi:hypothetical protein